MIRGRALLIKSFTFGAIDETLENNWTILDSGECPGGERQVIVHQVELRELGLPGKIRFVRVRDPNLASIDFEEFERFFFRHQSRLHPPAGLSQDGSQRRKAMFECEPSM